MESFRALQKQMGNEIHDISNEYIAKLSEIWCATFDRSLCEQNLRKLGEHVTVFFDEVLGETVQRRDRILSDINTLHEEASTLRRLLKVDIELSPQKGVPSYTALVKLDGSLHKLRENLKKRKDEIMQLLLEQESLCEELGESPRDLHDDPLPTEFELQQFRQHLTILREEKENRIGLIANLRREIKDYLADLELSIESDPEQTLLLMERRIPLTTNTLNQLREIHHHYRNQVAEVHDKIETMKSKLQVLWDCLETSPSIRQKFSRYTDYSQTTYDKFYRELSRCETQKRQNIQRFVDRIRGEIVLWWDKTLKSDLEKSRFSNFTNDCYTEDLLTLHELELEDLKRFYSCNEKIFTLIEQRQILWDKMMALEAKATEPSRFNNRGGQLLKEEKERKTIATKLPKIEAELTELVNEYEKAHNCKFLIYGEDLIESMARDWDMKKAEKEKLMSARKNANVTNTPLSRTVRTPMSVRNQSTIKKVSSCTNISASTSKKRKLNIDSFAPNAKRNLMPALGTPGTKNKTPFKSPAKRIKVVASTIKRRSGRISSSAKNHRRSTNMKPPKIVITKENTVNSDTMSYDVFEEYIEKDPSCRSSIVIGNKKKKRTTPNRLAGASSSVTTARYLVTSPRSPAGGSSRKLTTKNLPILM